MQDVREKQSLSFIIAFSTYPVINIVSMYIFYYVYVFFFCFDPIYSYGLYIEINTY